MNLKADQDLLEKFKKNVEDRVVSNLNQKLDKIDHKRFHNSFRKKLDSLEDRLYNKKAQNSSDFGNLGPLFTKSGNTCASCNRDLEGPTKIKHNSNNYQGGGFKASAG